MLEGWEGGKLEPAFLDETLPDTAEQIKVWKANGQWLEGEPERGVAGFEGFVGAGQTATVGLYYTRVTCANWSLAPCVCFVCGHTQGQCTSMSRSHTLCCLSLFSRCRSAATIGW